MRFLVSVVTALVVVNPSFAASCEGDASNSCNGLLNQCTSEGELCVVDTTTGSCCALSSASTAVMRSMGTCRSNIDASICNSESIITGTTSTHIAEADVGVTTTGQECFNVEIGLILDSKPGEIAWEITSGRKSTLQQPGATVVSTSPYYDPAKYQEASDTYIVCLPEGKYTFTMIDLGEDGMCCSSGEGKYAVTYKATGEMIAQGADFGSSESTVFKVPFVAPSLVDSDGDGVEDRTKNVIPTIPMTSDGKPSCSNEFGLHLVTDDYGVETTWELRERNDGSSNYTDGKIIASGGPYTSDFTYDVTYCVDPGKYTFIFYDWQCDGLMGIKTNGYYTVTVNGLEVHTGGTNMTRYDEVVELNFMNTLVGYEEVEGDASDLDMYKKRVSSSTKEKSVLGGFVSLVLLAATVWN